MFTATLDANNQITLPLEIRKQLRIRPGDKVQFVPSETGEVLLRNDLPGRSNGPRRPSPAPPRPWV